MADDIAVTPGTGAKMVANEVTRTNGAAKVQGVELLYTSGVEGSKTATPFSAEFGSTTDAAVKSATATGTLLGKMRGLVEMVFDVWDSVGHAIKVDPGQSVVSAAANATGTSKHRPVYASVAAALTGSAIKGSSGGIYGYHIANEHATTTMYAHIYDAASATGTPEVTLKVPGGSALDAPSINPPIGDWSTGMWLSFSANPDGSGNPPAIPLATIFYK